MNKRPNILQIITDQQSAFALSCTGNPWLKTPRLDRLAAQGIRFNHCFATEPLCVGARGSLITGLTTSQLYCYRGDDERTEEWPLEALHSHSIGSTLRDAGYETVYTGKWHLTKMGTPPDHRFAYYPSEATGYYGGQGPRVNKGMREFFETRDDTPFFAVASYIQPHGICTWANKLWHDNGTLKHGEWPEGQDPWSEGVKGDGYPFPKPPCDGDLAAWIDDNCPPLPDNFDIPDNEPEQIQEFRASPTNAILAGQGNGSQVKNLSKEQMWRLMAWTYYRLTETVDQEIGNLLDMLEEFNLDDNTVVMFVSDHGELLGAHQLRLKMRMYDESVRVPCFIRAPGECASAQIDDEHLINSGPDLTATIYDYAGIDIPAHVRGRSLRPLCRGETVPNWPDHVVLDARESRSVRSKDYAYSIYVDSPEQPDIFFDLRTDPGEMQNRIHDPDSAAAIQDMRQKLRDWEIDIGELPYAHPWKVMQVPIPGL